ncbi:MAG: MerR family transcriptional regulator [Bacilli bacterium]|nr:MerR family transcriptional regulator [Bacilli bacterium]MBO6195736.1 MerR family transcriptional regulator [Bacilli bacterium]
MLYKIGDFSDKCGVSVKTLRYYDEIDLFKPIEIDLFTGYRYYSDEQLEDLNIILKLKEASFSLEEIKEYWNNFDNDIMLKKKQELLNQINIYEDKIREIDYLRSNIVKGKIILNNKKEVNNIRKKVIEKR